LLETVVTELDRQPSDGQDCLSVFLSYSRKNRHEAEIIGDKLRDRGFRVFVDLQDILPTEAWRERLLVLIEQADAVVFLLSPASCTSEVCGWEVETATRLGKRIAPVVIEDVKGAAIPAMLSRLNYIFATERDRLENAVDSLGDALSGSAEWLREHTRYLHLALVWQRSGRRPRFLLPGDEALRASSWLAHRPNEVSQPSALVVKLINASLALEQSMKAYMEKKDRAMASRLRPLIEKEITALRESVRSVYNSLPTSDAPSGAGLAEESEIDIYTNFLEPDGRWHPLPAVISSVDEDINWGGGGTASTAVVRSCIFPCCGLKVRVSGFVSTPDQFRVDGCSVQPAWDFPPLQRPSATFDVKSLTNVPSDFAPAGVVIFSSEPNAKRWTYKDFRRESWQRSFDREMRFYIAFRCQAGEPAEDGKVFFAYYPKPRYSDEIEKMHHVIGPLKASDHVRKQCIWYFAFDPQPISSLAPGLFHEDDPQTA
jgi:hypothetical protein